MKKKIIFILWAFFIFSTGCEQLIDIDLNDAQPALVIEADLSSPEGVLTVVVTKTGSYFETGSIQKVDDAVVYLENNHARQEKADAKGNGIYKLENINAEPGDSFKLMVEVEGTVYSALSTVKAPVNIDSITYSWYEGNSFYRPGYRFNLTFTDRAKEKNYYRIRVYKNKYLFNRDKDLVVFDDTDLDGQVINVKLHNQYHLEKGETATLELMSIDRKAWEYFTSLVDLVYPEPGSPAPGNPVPNFSNGALGYFYAWSCSRKAVTIEE